jgi:hypothetical protein
MWKWFICESCQVRATLRRELQRMAVDVVLLMFERATSIDTFNHWSEGTLKSYRSKFNVLKAFELDFNVHTLPQPQMEHPPRG